MQSSKQGVRKMFYLSIEGIRKGYLFREKMAYNMVRGWTSGADTFVEYPSPEVKLQ